MSANVTYNNFYEIVINNTPLIDVRAPIEFQKGAFENTINLPIMNNHERHLVGTCYKEKGHEKATELGYQLVSGIRKEERVHAWIEHIRSYPNCMIYCFRGGQRSRISQEWIHTSTGEPILRLEGGYKAFRNYLLKELLPEAQKSLPILLGGYTGSGKTILLKKLKNAIDLEGLAHHRGSSFGQFTTPQPSQINFENNLAYALIKHRHHGFSHMVLEDEGKHIGRCYIPLNLRNYFSSGKLVLLHVPFEERVSITLDEYVIHSQQEHCQTFGDEQGLLSWADYIRTSIYKLKKRLGGVKYSNINTMFENALLEQLRTNTVEQHRDWIACLLKEYYDPMYAYQLERSNQQIIFEGTSNEVLEFLKT